MREFLCPVCDVTLVAAPEVDADLMCPICDERFRLSAKLWQELQFELERRVTAGARPQG